MPGDNEASVRVRMAEVDSICVYQVTEDELDILERGSPGSLALNFGIFFISLAVSFFISLLTTEMTTNTFIVFVVITVVGFAAGIVLLAFWLNALRSSKSIIKRIKERLKEDIAPKIELNDSVEPKL